MVLCDLEDAGILWKAVEVIPYKRNKNGPNMELEGAVGSGPKKLRVLGGWRTVEGATSFQLVNNI